MSSRRPPRNQPPKMRGPSRPVDPRYPPGAPVKRGADTFAITLIGVSSALVVLVVFLLFTNRNTTTTPVAQQPTQAVVVPTLDPAQQAAAGTITAIAFATQTSALPSISAQEALQLYQSGNAKIVDVRVKESYDKQRIKGATSVPQKDTFAVAAKEYPKTGNVIVYCQ
jgi:hypothetical protein